MTASEDVKVDVVLLTTLEFEYEAVRSHLSEPQDHIDTNGNRYLIGTLPGGRCRVSLAMTGPGAAATAFTRAAITSFRPSALILTGVAIGLTPEVSVGDLVVVTDVYADTNETLEDGNHGAPRSWAMSHALQRDAREVAHEAGWTWLLSEAVDDVPAVHFKPSASAGVAPNLSDDTREAERVAARYGDAAVFDAESARVVEAAHHQDFHRTIIVRGVSDRAGARRDADNADNQRIVMTRAAAFVIAVAERIAEAHGNELSAGSSPYRGLAAFGEEDTAVFFGRASATDELAAMVLDQRFVAVVGRSGSGKSSLVYAGLIPHLRRLEWVTAAFRPLPDVPAPIALAGSLLSLLPPALEQSGTSVNQSAVAEALVEGRAADVVGDVLAAAKARGLLVCVDQFEELVAWREKAAEELVDLLVQLATSPAAVHVVLTMRTETLDVIINRLGLGDLTRNSVFFVQPMSARQLRAAIEEPVRSTGITFEPGLVERILDAATDAPAALTLMQFALTRLWDEQDQQQMTHHVYDKFNGFVGALATYAEQVWERDLDKTQRKDAPRLLVQLVRPDADDFVRRTARERELAPELIPLARHLATTRLLVIGTDANNELTIDLAHAALATHWQRLRDWMAEEREFRAWQEDLRENIRRQELLHGNRLADAVRRLDKQPREISINERNFILTSKRRRRMVRTGRQSLLAFILALLAIATTSVFILGQKTGELEDQVRHNAAQGLINQARDRIGNAPDSAALLSVAAYRSSHDPTVLANLASEYQRYRTTDQLVNPKVGQVLDLAASSDGRTIAVAGLDGAALIRLGNQATTIKSYDRDVRRIALSQDGQLLATANDLGRIELIRANGSRIVLREGGPQADLPTTLRFDDQGDRLLAKLSVGGLVVWDVVRREQLRVPDAIEYPPAAPTSVWFGPDGQSIVVVTRQDVTLWPLSEGGEPRQVTTLTESGTAIVAGDGRTAVTCEYATFTYWDLTTVQEQTSKTIPNAFCPGVNQRAIDRHAQATTVFSSPESGSHPRESVWLIDRTSDRMARTTVPTPAGPGATVAPWLTTTASGSRIIAAVGTGVAVVNVPTNRLAPINALDSVSPLFSPDLRYALTATSPTRQTLDLWDTKTGDRLASDPKRQGVRPLWFNANSTRLIALTPENEHLLIFELPTLRVINTIDLPTEMRQNRERFPGRFAYACATSLRSPDDVAVLYAGLVIRLDAHSGIVSGQPLRLWRQDAELGRLADTVSCQGRPNTAQLAFDAGASVELWNLDRGSRQLIPVKNLGKISSLRFSLDGRQLAISGFAGAVGVWDTQLGLEIEQPRQVVSANLGVEVKGFPVRDQLLVRGESVLRMWDLEEDAATVDIETITPESSAIAPNGGNLLYWGLAGVTDMPLDPAQWANHLCRVVDRDLTDAERQDLPPGSDAGPTC